MRARWTFSWLVAIGALLSMGTPNATSQMTGDPPPASTSDPDLTADIERLISRRAELADSRIGVFASTVGSSSVLVDRSGIESFNSASNTKIVTAAAALALLGGDFSFSTGLWGAELSPDGTKVKTLYLVGGADPSLGIDHVDGLARDLVATGIRTIDRVAVDDSYFDNKDTPPHFDEQPREEAAFRAPVNAAGLGFNSFAVHVIPSPTGAGPARVIVDPPVDYLNVVENNVTTVARGRARLRIGTSVRRGRLDIRVTGRIRKGAARRVRRRVPGPSAFAGSVLRWSLKRAGIRVASRSHREADLPPAATLLVARRSEPLAVLVRGLGKYSNNYMAETLLKTIGAETDDGDRPATWESGLSAVRGYLTGAIGLTDGEFTYGNGSGLFESNRFTPKQLVTILDTAARDARMGAELVSSLAVGGVDGTLRSRMEESEARGLVRAKTGTLATTSALSGYAQAPDGGPIAFSILINEVPPGEISAARELQDDIAGMLVKFSRGR